MALSRQALHRQTLQEEGSLNFEKGVSISPVSTEARAVICCGVKITRILGFLASEVPHAKHGGGPLCSPWSGSASTLRAVGRASRSAVAGVADFVEVPVSSPPAGAAASYVAKRPEFVMETFDQVDVPPIKVEDLRIAWQEYPESAQSYGTVPAATMPAVLRPAATLVRDSHTLGRTRSALAEVQSALSGLLHACVRDLTDGAISDVLGRFGLEPERSFARGADGDPASNSVGAPARDRPRSGPSSSE